VPTFFFENNSFEIIVTGRGKKHSTGSDGKGSWKWGLIAVPKKSIGKKDHICSFQRVLEEVPILVGVPYNWKRGEKWWRNLITRKFLLKKQPGKKFSSIAHQERFL